MWGGVGWCGGSGAVFVYSALRDYWLFHVVWGSLLAGSSCCQLSAKLLVTTLPGSLVFLPLCSRVPDCWWSGCPRDSWRLPRPWLGPDIPCVLTTQVVDSVICHLLQFLLFCLLYGGQGRVPHTRPAPLIVSNLCIPAQPCGLSSYQIANYRT